MQVRRVFGLAADLRSAVCAGTIDSRNGSEIETPRPRSSVRRDKCFLVMNIILSYSSEGEFFTLIWKGVLSTTPRTYEENRLSFLAASRTMVRTAGISK